MSYIRVSLHIRMSHQPGNYWEWGAEAKKSFFFSLLCFYDISKTITMPRIYDTLNKSLLNE